MRLFICVRLYDQNERIDCKQTFAHKHSFAIYLDINHCIIYFQVKRILLESKNT